MQETGYKEVDLVELGRMIRAVREASNLSADELAAAAGSITRPSLTRLECGKSGAPTFDTVYRILRAVGELDIIKSADFDFRPYSEETVALLHYFIKKEDGDATWPNYSKAISKQIAESCDHWAKHELDTLLFFVQCKNGRDYVMPQAEKMDKSLKDKGLEVSDINPDDVTEYVINHTDYLIRLKQFARYLGQENQFPEIFKLIGELIEKLCNHVELIPTEE